MFYFICMKRLLQSKLEDMLRSDDQRVILLEGARQVGKSYLVNCALKSLNMPFFSFDLEKNRLFRHELDETTSFSDFRALLQLRYGVTNGSVLFIDESQESRTLARYIKSFKEDWPELKVLLTGSSMNRLFDETTRIPVGRTRSLCLFGFSFSEFVQCVHGEDLAALVRTVPDVIEPSVHRLLLELFDRYMHVGGYPEAVLAHHRGEDFKGVVEEIIMTQEDDFARKEAYDPELFRMTLRAVANHIGSPSKYTHLDTTKYKAREVISAMKAWHLLLEVEVKSLDPERDGFFPKRYLHDLAMINRFRAVAAPPLSLINTVSPALRTPLGGAFENAVLIHLLSGLSAYAEVATWKQGSSNGMEVDFIVESGDARIPVECKAATTLKRSHYSAVLAYLRAAQQHVGLVVSAAPFEQIETDGKRIINLPVYLANRTVIENLVNKM